MDLRHGLLALGEGMERSVKFVLGLLWLCSLLVSAYGAFEIVVWTALGAEEPHWLEHPANLLTKLFDRSSPDALRSTVDTVATALVAFASGALASKEKSLTILWVCTVFVLASGISYFMFNPSWPIYGGPPAIAAAKQAFYSVVQLNIVLLAAHLGITLGRRSPESKAPVAKKEPQGGIDVP